MSLLDASEILFAVNVRGAVESFQADLDLVHLVATYFVRFLLY